MSGWAYLDGAYSWVQLAQMQITGEGDVSAHANQNRARKIRCAVSEIGKSFESFRGLTRAPGSERAGGDQRKRQADAEGEHEDKAEKVAFELQTKQKHGHSCGTGKQSPGQTEERELTDG